MLFLHDVEKIYKYVTPAIDFDKAVFINQLEEQFGFALSDEEKTALKYIHGESDDYRKDRRVMNELGGICHAADIVSARVLHSVRE